MIEGGQAAGLMQSSRKSTGSSTATDASTTGATGVVGFGCATSATGVSLSPLAGAGVGLVVFELPEDVLVPPVDFPKRLVDSEEL